MTLEIIPFDIKYFAKNKKGDLKLMVSKITIKWWEGTARNTDQSSVTPIDFTLQTSRRFSALKRLPLNYI